MTHTPEDAIMQTILHLPLANPQLMWLRNKKIGNNFKTIRINRSVQIQYEIQMMIFFHRYSLAKMSIELSEDETTNKEIIVQSGHAREK